MSANWGLVSHSEFDGDGVLNRVRLNAGDELIAPVIVPEDPPATDGALGARS